MGDWQSTLNQVVLGNLTVGQLVLVSILVLAALGAFSVLGFILRIPRLLFGPGCGCVLLLGGLLLAVMVAFRR
jgi:hypothetical protein